MTDPELLKLARHARNALVVIAASCAILATLALVSIIPPLASLFQWFFADSSRVATVVAVVLVAATLGYVASALSGDTPRQTPAPKPD